MAETKVTPLELSNTVKFNVYRSSAANAGNGAFAGMYIKDDDPASNDYYDIDIYDNYIHDTGGEGVYIGTTASDPAQQLFNLTFHNNTVARSGNEGIQAGQLAGGADI